jgi:hypothetical protein
MAAYKISTRTESLVLGMHPSLLRYSVFLASKVEAQLAIVIMFELEYQCHPRVGRPSLDELTSDWPIIPHLYNFCPDSHLKEGRLESCSVDIVSPLITSQPCPLPLHCRQRYRKWRMISVVLNQCSKAPRPQQPCRCSKGTPKSATKDYVQMASHSSLTSIPPTSSNISKVTLGLISMLPARRSLR